MDFDTILNATIEYIDEEAQHGNAVEISEIIDATRAMDDAPEDEAELDNLAQKALSKLVDDRAIVKLPDGTYELAVRDFDE